MDQFLQLFGNISIADIIGVGCAIGFLTAIFCKVSKYFKGKVIADKEKNDEWKKVIDQVNQYPKWHEQSIKIRDGLKESIDGLSEKIDAMQLKSDRKYATTCRYRIIRFNDEILRQVKHTKEHFDQILIDIDDYEEYCRKDKDYKNNKAMLAIENIKNVYKKCAEESAFL